MAEAAVVIVGRSSSHFTRLTRMFAEELGVVYRFEPVRDLMALDAAAYAGNPALKLPILGTDRGSWFGSVNICRELSRQAGARPLRIIWPEDHHDPRSSNALELTLQGMSTAVALIMQTLSAAPDNPATPKLRASLELSVEWLDHNLASALEPLPPERDVSLLEVALFCFCEHLTFRDVLALSPFHKLVRFCDTYGKRPAARRTEYRFDP